MYRISFLTLWTTITTPQYTVSTLLPFGLIGSGNRWLFCTEVNFQLFSVFSGDVISSRKLNVILRVHLQPSCFKFPRTTCYCCRDCIWACWPCHIIKIPICTMTDRERKKHINNIQKEIIYNTTRISWGIELRNQIVSIQKFAIMLYIYWVAIPCLIWGEIRVDNSVWNVFTQLHTDMQRSDIQFVKAFQCWCAMKQWESSVGHHDKTRAV